MNLVDNILTQYIREPVLAKSQFYEDIQDALQRGLEFDKYGEVVEGWYAVKVKTPYEVLFTDEDCSFKRFRGESKADLHSDYRSFWRANQDLKKSDELDATHWDHDVYVYYVEPWEGEL